MFYSENRLWEILLPVVKAGVASLPGMAVKRAYQPTTQGDGNAPRLLLHRAYSRRYGAQSTSQEWRVDEYGQGKMIAVDTWRKEDTYQANALVNREPEDEGYTAKDALELLSAHLQSEPALMALKKEGIGVLRVNDITETPYEDDRGSYRVSVSLQFTITYKQTQEREVPVATGADFRIYRV